MKYKLHIAEKEKQDLSEAENKALHTWNDIEKMRSNVRVMEKAVSIISIFSSYFRSVYLI